MMLNIFKYKKMYFDVCNDLANKCLRLDSTESEMQKLKKQLRNVKNDFKELHEKYLYTVENYEQIVKAKEHLRRKNSGKIGGLQNKINHLVKERNQMIDLINNLIQENQKIKEKLKKTSLENMRHIRKY